MFNLGPMELAVILILALLIFGPKKLPEIGKGVGQAMREFKRASRDLMDSFHEAMDDHPKPVAAVDSYVPPSSVDSPYAYQPPGAVATTDEPAPAGGESYSPEAHDEEHGTEAPAHLENGHPNDGPAASPSPYEASPVAVAAMHEPAAVTGTDEPAPAAATEPAVVPATAEPVVAATPGMGTPSESEQPSAHAPERTT